MGLTFHLANLAVCLRRAAEGVSFRLILGSTGGEQFPGLWDRVRAVYSEEDLCRLTDQAGALRTAVEGLLQQHDQLLVHVGGVRQLREIIPLRRSCRERLQIVFTVNSYRHGSWAQYPVSFLMSCLFRRHVDFVNFLTPWTLEQFPLVGSLLRQRRAGCIPWGMEQSGPSIAPVTAPMLRERLEDPNAFRFIYLAFFHKHKGHSWLFESLAPLLKQHPHAQLVLPGSGFTWERLRQRVAAEGLESQVLLPGKVDRHQIPAILDRCHVGIVPSRCETFGHNYIEPMARGLPVIGTRTGVGQWVLQDYVTGLGVSYGQEASLRDAARFMVENPQAAKQMGENARHLVETHLTWPKIAAAHLGLYQDILSRGRHGADRAERKLEEPRRS